MTHKWSALKREWKRVVSDFFQLRACWEEWCFTKFLSNLVVPCTPTVFWEVCRVLFQPKNFTRNEIDLLYKWCPSHMSFTKPRTSQHRAAVSLLHTSRWTHIQLTTSTSHSISLSKLGVLPRCFHGIQIHFIPISISSKPLNLVDSAEHPSICTLQPPGFSKFHLPSR